MIKGYAVYDKDDQIVADSLSVSADPVPGEYIDRACRRDCAYNFLHYTQGNKFANMEEAAAAGFRIEKVTAIVSIDKSTD